MEVVKLAPAVSVSVMRGGRSTGEEYLFGFDQSIGERQAFKVWARAHAHGKDIILAVDEQVMS